MRTTITLEDELLAEAHGGGGGGGGGGVWGAGVT